MGWGKQGVSWEMRKWRIVAFQPTNGSICFSVPRAFTEILKIKEQTFLFTRNDLIDALAQINALYLINDPSTLLRFY